MTTQAPLPSLQIAALDSAYQAGPLTPELVLRAIYARIAELAPTPIFITLTPLEQALAALERQSKRRAAGEKLPLYGVPFAVKDNIDVAGLPTTAGCPAFARAAEQTAFAVERLLAAGAILIGKTNLDQFATGLVGVRSPYGVCRSAIDSRYVAGGSSSGSALAVAHGLVSFALGTDTAGSGRVPAAFNNIVGVKPTRGLVSTSGVVPACRSLDCVSVFAGSVSDGFFVLELMAGFDAADSFSRKAPQGSLEWPALPSGLRVAVPQALEFFGNADYEASFASACSALSTLGATLVPVDIDAFIQAGALLYGGPWVAERYAAVGAFVESHPDQTNAVVRSIILQGKEPSAYEVFRAQYRLADLRRQSESVWQRADVLLLPTTGTAYTVEEVEADPIRLNANLGRYTNFLNLLDLAAVAVPAGFTAAGLPFGVTLAGPAFSDALLGVVADGFQRSQSLPIGATAHTLAASEPKPGVATTAAVLLAVAGAHLSGMPLNHELTSRGAKLVRKCRTAADYELYALAGTTPPKPGLVRKPDFAGPGIEVELWSLTQAAFGSFVQGIPAPMVIGTVRLDDGSSVKGFLCEPYALHGSRNITAYGGWRAFMRESA